MLRVHTPLTGCPPNRSVPTSIHTRQYGFRRKRAKGSEGQFLLTCSYNRLIRLSAKACETIHGGHRLRHPPCFSTVFRGRKVLLPNTFPRPETCAGDHALIGRTGWGRADVKLDCRVQIEIFNHLRFVPAVMVWRKTVAPATGINICAAVAPGPHSLYCRAFRRGECAVLFYLNHGGLDAQRDFRPHYSASFFQVVRCGVVAVPGSPSRTRRPGRSTALPQTALQNRILGRGQIWLWLNQIKLGREHRRRRARHRTRKPGR
jgi:hypothetical protein